MGFFLALVVFAVYVAISFHLLSNVEYLAEHEKHHSHVRGNDAETFNKKN